MFGSHPALLQHGRGASVFALLCYTTYDLVWPEVPNQKIAHGGTQDSTFLTLGNDTV